MSLFEECEGEPPPRVLLVLGGRQHPEAVARVEGNRHVLAVAGLLDCESGEYREIATREPPARVLPPQGRGQILFGAGTIVADRLWTCTKTELLVYRLPSFELLDAVSHPWFQDLHHVLPIAEDAALVVATGVDRVFEVTLSGEVRREWRVGPGGQARVLEPGKDYRRVVSTKPHLAHPNYVFAANEELWVTRFEQRDALSLTHPPRRIAIDIERPHDGLVVGESVWFTTVDGRLVEASLAAARVTRVVDLQGIAASSLALGWCRGLCALGADRFAVAFSRLRPTRFRRNVRWLKHRVGLAARSGNLPTRIASFDLRRGELLWEVELERHGVNMVFALLPWRFDCR